MASTLPRYDAAAVAASFPAGDRTVASAPRASNSLTLSTSDAAAIRIVVPFCVATST
jgi:hypothetical protein